LPPCTSLHLFAPLLANTKDAITAVCLAPCLQGLRWPAQLAVPL
jgi:hypothetical protein